MIKYYSQIITAVFIVFIAWISFIPEPVKYGFNGYIDTVFISILILSLGNHKFDLKSYFIDRNWALWFYLALLSLNTWFSENTNPPYAYYRGFIITVVPVYFILQHEMDKGCLRRILYFLCICASLVALFGFFEMLFKYNILYEKYIDNGFYLRYLYKNKRMMSTLMHPSVLASYLAPCLPLAYYFYKSEKRARIKNINFTVLLLVFFAIIFTFSRGAWLSLLLIFSIWMIHKKKIKILFMVWAAVILLILFSSSELCFVPGLQYRFSLKKLYYQIASGHRIKALFATWDMFKDHPFTGIGLTNFRALFDQYSKYKLPHEYMIPENVYLMHLAETGLMGSIGFMVFLGNTISKAFKYYNKAEGEAKELFSAALLSFLVILANMNAYDMFLWKTPIYLFLVFAGILACFSMEKKPYQ